MADRRAIIGVSLFGGLVLLCFGFALILVSRESSDTSAGPRIGVVQVEGVISGESARRGIRGLKGLRDDETIKAIVVRIDSPGGMVGPSQELYREIERTKTKKPVVASLGAVAASGGYYVAAACDRIVASAGTITGSIGVITQTTQIEQLLALARIETHTFKSGKYKDTGTPLRPMQEDEKSFLQSFVLEVHGQFVRDVSRGRKLEEKWVEPVADGRILTGEQARKHRLVDKLGNFSDALETAAALAGEEGEPVAVPVRERRGLLQELLRDSADALAQRLSAVVAGGGGTSIEARDPRLR